jgi:hypothetical protein
MKFFNRTIPSIVIWDFLIFYFMNNSYLEICKTIWGVGVFLLFLFLLFVVGGGGGGED